MTKEVKRTILCVDDEQDIVDSLFDTFMDTYNVKIATSAQAALDIFEKEDISVIITDQRMPVMQGTELLAKINEVKPICKKILLTGYSDIQAAIDAINLGSVDKYMTKPWEDEDLIAAVESLISVYKVDEVFQKIIKDGKNLKSNLDNYKKSSDLFVDFMESYNQGIAIINTDEIEYINQKGLSLLGYKSQDELGKHVHYQDVFEIDSNILNNLKEKHINKIHTPEDILVRLKNGQSTAVQMNGTFIQLENDLAIRGIVFCEPE
ncbi:chemotaxis protein CheY [Candidatus Magnetomorum sp. HK-1]|nr:chemotaxis protein CheY [Candidatus Magnetomorum sp. HK-1]